MSLTMEDSSSDNVDDFMRQVSEREDRLKVLRDYRRKRLRTETPEQRMTRLIQDREYKRKKRIEETPDMRELRLRKDRERKQIRRLFETPEQRQLNAEKNKERRKRKRLIENNAISIITTHAFGDIKGSEERLQPGSAFEDSSSINKITDQRERRLQREREYKRMKRSLEPLELKQQRLKKERERKMMRKLFEQVQKHNDAFRMEIEIIQKDNNNAQISKDFSLQTHNLQNSAGFEIIKLKQDILGVEL